MPSVEEASGVFLKSKQDQLSYLIQASPRIEKGLATLTQNQESLERIVETKFYDLDQKVTEIQTAVEQLQEEAEERQGNHRCISASAKESKVYCRANDRF